MQHRN